MFLSDLPLKNPGLLEIIWKKTEIDEYGARLEMEKQRLSIEYDLKRGRYSNYSSRGTTETWRSAEARFIENGKVTLGKFKSSTEFDEPPVYLSYPLIFSTTKMQPEVGASLRQFSHDES